MVLTWLDPPVGCGWYDFVLTTRDGEGFLIGTDLNPSDGVSVIWEVPENARGTLTGLARCAEGRQLNSRWSGELYSGSAPPEGVCSIASATVGALDVYSEPSPSGQVFGILPTGTLLPVFRQNERGWYQVESSGAIIGESGELDGTDWVSPDSAVVLFGPCEQEVIDHDGD